MFENIHRWLIVRLALVWLVLSLVIGGLVHYLGNARLDHHVTDMAKAETTNYSGEFASFLKAPSPEALARFDGRIRSMIEADNLIVVEFYDASSRQITEVVKPSARAAEAALPKHERDLSRNEGVVTEQLKAGAQTYLRVFSPIQDPRGGRIGYLEAVDQAPAEIVTQIKSQTLWALITVVLAILATSLALYPLIISLNGRLLDYSRVLALTNIGMLKVLGSAIAKRDSDTNIHNYRVTLYSVRIGELLGLPHQAMQGLIKGAFLHDVGKIAITDAILLKSGKLTDQEFEVMKSHVGHGEDIICNYAWLEDAGAIVGNHHERYDGSGYPLGAAGDDIPLTARIFAVADVFDALTSRRPYKEPFSFPVSVGIIGDSRGNHFDPVVVDLFLEHAKTLHAEICQGDEALLHNKLEACIAAYF